MYISQHKYCLLGNNRKYFLSEKDTNFDDVRLKISFCLKRLACNRPGSLILFIQILTYLKKPNSYIIIIGKF